MQTTSSATQSVVFPSRVGVWWHPERWPIRQAMSVIQDIEAMGYGSVFVPEGIGKNVLVESAAFLTATDRLVVGTGIANIHFRIPTAAETGARTLTALHPGRFVLGLGVSHRIAGETLGFRYEKPLMTMRNYLERMNAVPPAVEEGATPTRLLAALGPKMIAMSGELAHGAHPYLVTPEQTRKTREILGLDKLVVTEQAVSIGGDHGGELLRARSHTALYTSVTNYRQSLLRQGFDERDLEFGGSNRLVRALVGVGLTQSVNVVHAQLDAGADHVVVQIAGDDLAYDPRSALRELARELGL